MYHYEEEYETQKCHSCSEHESNLKYMKHWLENIIEMIYSADDLDAESFEISIQELCSYVGIKVPKNDICITRKKSNVHHISKILDIEDWKKWNVHHLKNLIN